MNTNVTRSRIYYLDVLRAIACMCVVMIHCSVLYSAEEVYLGSANYLACLIFEGISRLGVPVFVMISGALLLDEDRDAGFAKTRGHILRMILFFIFWSAVYCLVFQVADPMLKNEPVRLSGVGAALITGPVHLWYIYFIIGIYLIVPLLRLWVKKDNIKYVGYFILLAFVFQSVLANLTEIGLMYHDAFRHFDYILGSGLRLSYVSGLTVYFVLGWYLNNREFKRPALIYILGAASLLVMIGGSYAIGVTKDTCQRPLYAKLSPFVFMWSVSVFVFVKRTFKNAEENRFILAVSRLSLGIYAVHPMLITLLFTRFLQPLLPDAALLNIPLMYITVFALSCAVSYLLGRIPGLKRLV